MGKSTVLEALEFLERCLKEKGVAVSKLVLFGSQGAGSATGESDIDVVIISEDFRGKDIFQRVELFKDAEALAIKKFLVPFDIVPMTPEEFQRDGSLIAEYAKGGRVISSTEG